MAMAYTSKELIWLSRMVNDLQVAEPSVPVLYCDSTAALHIAKNPVFHERTKHIDRDCHSIREKLVRGQLKTLHVWTENQLADPFTKALYPALFHRFMSKMGFLNILTPS